MNYFSKTVLTLGTILCIHNFLKYFCLKRKSLLASRFLHKIDKLSSEIELIMLYDILNYRIK